MTAIAWAQRGVERLDPVDLPLLHQFQTAAFGANSLPVQAHYHRWIYDEVPYPDPEGVQFWVCKRNGAIVGQQCGMPFPLHIGDEVTRSSWAIDLMVAPEWRLRGVGPGLSESHALASPVTVSLGMTDAAFKAYSRTGWIGLGTVPTFVRPIDARRCRTVSPYRGPLVNIATALAGPALTGLSLASGTMARLRGARLVEIPAFDARADTLWEAAKGQAPVMARRDLNWLRWRFDAIWMADKLRRFYVMRRGEVMGYLVLRIDQWKGEPIAVVIDYLARPGWLGPAFALAIERARKDGATALLCRTLNARAVRTFGSLGFLCLKNGLRMPTRIMARTGPGGERFKEVISDPKNWIITTADSDMGFRSLGE